MSQICDGVCHGCCTVRMNKHDSSGQDGLATRCTREEGDSTMLDDDHAMKAPVTP